MEEYSASFCKFIGSREGLEYLQAINNAFGGELTLTAAIEIAAFQLGEK